MKIFYSAYSIWNFLIILFKNSINKNWPTHKNANIQTRHNKNNGKSQKNIQNHAISKFIHTFTKTKKKTVV